MFGFLMRMFRPRPLFSPLHICRQSIAQLPELREAHGVLRTSGSICQTRMYGLKADVLYVSNFTIKELECDCRLASGHSSDLRIPYTMIID
jgi:hypothetical protein